LADFRKDSKENRYWLSNLTRSYTNGNSPEDVLKFEEMVNAVTAKDLQNIAKNNTTKDKVIGMLMPEKNNFLVLKLKPAISLK
jgi:zinc protease